MPATVAIDPIRTQHLHDLSKDPKIAKYALEKMESIRDKFPKLVEAFDVLLQNQELAAKNLPDIWHGADANTSFKQFQGNLLDAAKNDINTLMSGKPVQMLFAMNEDGKFLRGYKVDGKLLEAKNEKDKKIIDTLDVMFNAVLAKNNLISKDGGVYKSTEHGVIEKEGDKLQSANRETITSKISSDIKNALSEVGIPFDLTERKYPEKVAAPGEKKAEKPEAPKGAAPGAEEVDQKQGVEQSERPDIP